HRTVGEADRHLRIALLQHHRLEPVGIAGTDRRSIELAGPILIDIDFYVEVGPAAAAIEFGKTIAQRLCGCVLHHRIHRAAHPKTAGVETIRTVLRILAELLDQLAADLFHEITALLMELLVAAVANSAERR